MKPLASDYGIAYKSQNPESEYCYSPSILVLKNGRYVMSHDLSDKFGKIYVSDDKGKTWRLTAEEEFLHANLFADGDTLYLIGCCKQKKGSLIIMRSDDMGDTWSKAEVLDEGSWHHSPADAWYKDGYVYLVMEKKIIHEGEVVRSGWKPNIFAPVVLRGKSGADLTKRENWLFSGEVRFRDVIDEKDVEGIGVPFFKSLEEIGDDDVHGETFWADPVGYRASYDFKNDKPSAPFYFHATGWLEANIVEITDPKHYWYDPSGKTIHIFMRANTHGTGYCAVMKAVERVRDGREVIDIECQKNPSGKRCILLPMPGGQNKFYIKYDKKTKLYWLASVQVRDSMTRTEFLSEDRYNIPSDERDRLVLHYSKNMVDWIFAGLVDKTDKDKQARHYASMDIDGDDLVILSRSGDKDAKSAHDGNLITFHRVKNFRDLIY